MTRPVRMRPQALMIATALALAGCASIGSSDGTTKVGSGPYEKGSGTVASEARTVPPFHAVSAAQGVHVEIAPGPAAVTVSADDNLLSHVTTAVVDDTLVVDVSGSIETRQPLKVLVWSATTLERLSASTGASIDAGAVDATALVFEANTGASVRGGGHVEDVTVTAVSGASVDLRDLAGSHARVDVNTGSTAHVNATDAVTGTCSLGSTLVVHGGGSTTGVAVDSTSSMAQE